MRPALFLPGMMLATAAIAEPVADGPQKARTNYILYCSGCHGLNGKGTAEGGVPGFPNSVGYIASLESGRDYILQVPGVVNTRMSDAETAEVLNYILNEWAGGEAPDFSAQEVSQRRTRPARNVVVFRREIARDLRAAGIEISEYPWP